MITHLPAMPLPTESTLDISIRVTQPLNITSFSAQQLVTQYVMLELSTQLGGDPPELTVGGGKSGRSSSIPEKSREPV